MADKTNNHGCREIRLKAAEECQPCPPGLRNGFICRFCGQRKNLRGVKRRVGDVWQLPRGFVCYTPAGWTQMVVPESIQREILTTEKKQQH